MGYGTRSTRTESLTDFVKKIDAKIQTAEGTRAELANKLKDAMGTTRKDIELVFRTEKYPVPVVTNETIYSPPITTEVIGTFRLKCKHMTVVAELVRSNVDYLPPYTVVMSVSYMNNNQTRNCTLENIFDLSEKLSDLFLLWCNANEASVREIRS